jgi:hypothetical protein
LELVRDQQELVVGFLERLPNVAALQIGFKS